MAGHTRPASLAALCIAFVALGAPLLMAPRLVRGYSAARWVEHYAAMASLPRPRRASAHAMLAKMAAAVNGLAPLPWASAAPLRALEIGERIEHQDHDRETALLIYQGVRESCAAARERPFPGAGFAVVEARAAALESAVAREIVK